MSEHFKNNPAVSIIIRTQGKRLKCMVDVFECLNSQISNDFEIIIVGHKIIKESSVPLMKIIEQQPLSIREKIIFLQLDTGNRGAPLNYGFEHANGKYALILDDDDLVKADWVSTFVEGINQHEGRVLHCYPLVQLWYIDDNGMNVPYCDPTKELCRPFILSRQFSDNHCPPVCMAFPLEGFREMKIKFDEELDCYEDWDYIMKMVAAYGISDIPKETCIYRLWKNAESSHTVCSEERWIECKNEVIKIIENLQFTICGDDIVKEREFVEEFDSNLKRIQTVESEKLELQRSIDNLPSLTKYVFSRILNKIKK